MFSFYAAIKEDLKLPPGGDGEVQRYSYDEIARAFSTIHRHPELEVNLVVQGTASYLLEGSRYELRPDSLVWLFPEQNHILIDQSEDYQMWIGVFKPELINRICTSASSQPLKETSPTGNFCKQLDIGRSRRLSGLFKEIEEARPDAARFNAGLGYLLLLAWDAHLSSTEPLTGSVIHPAVKQAIQLMQSEDDLTGVRELANRVGLSASRLSHLFKEQTGLSLVEFQNNQCLRRFLELYEPARPAPILEIALQAGFGSYPQFYRVFKRHTGYNPAEYFRQHRVLSDN